MAAVQADKLQAAGPPLEKTDPADAEKQPEAVAANTGPPYSILTTWQKRGMVLAAAVTAFFSPLAAQIYLPALTSISDDLGVSSTQINLTITTYMIFQGTIPMFVGALADSGGRRPAYIACFVIFIAANIGLAVAPGYGALLGLRCLQSAGSSSTVALCMAVVADIITSAERGKYIGYTVVPVVLAPALGPVIGGLLSEFLGWRSTFWFLAITAGATLILLVLFFPETNRHIVGDGSITPPPLYRTVWQMVQRNRRDSGNEIVRQTSRSSSGTPKFKFKPPNILDSLFMLFEKETSLLLAGSSVVFAGFYMVSAAMPTLFKNIYHYDDVEVGLMYLPMAVGSVGAAIISSPAMSWNYKRHCKRLGIPIDRNRQQDLTEFPIERVRLEVGTPMLAVTGSAIITWGWTLDRAVHVAAPCVLSALLGIGLISYNNTVNALLVDLHPGKAGTATAANNFARCLIGAGATAAIVPLINAIGIGPSFTLVGGFYFLFIPAQMILMAKGMKWRTEKRQKEEKKAKLDDGR